MKVSSVFAVLSITLVYSGSVVSGTHASSSSLSEADSEKYPRPNPNDDIKQLHADNNKETMSSKNEITEDEFLSLGPDLEKFVNSIEVRFFFAFYFRLITCSLQRL